jgi:hypothetical protein
MLVAFKHHPHRAPPLELPVAASRNEDDRDSKRSDQNHSKSSSRITPLLRQLRTQLPCGPWTVPLHRTSRVSLPARACISRCFARERGAPQCDLDTHTLAQAGLRHGSNEPFLRCVSAAAKSPAQVIVCSYQTEPAKSWTGTPVAGYHPASLARFAPHHATRLWHSRRYSRRSQGPRLRAPAKRGFAHASLDPGSAAAATRKPARDHERTGIQQTPARHFQIHEATWTGPPQVRTEAGSPRNGNWKSNGESAETTFPHAILVSRSGPRR